MTTVRKPIFFDNSLHAKFSSSLSNFDVFKFDAFEVLVQNEIDYNSHSEINSKKVIIFGFFGIFLVYIIERRTAVIDGEGLVAIKSK